MSPNSRSARQSRWVSSSPFLALSTWTARASRSFRVSSRLPKSCRKLLHRPRPKVLLRPLLLQLPVEPLLLQPLLVATRKPLLPLGVLPNRPPPVRSLPQAPSPLLRPRSKFRVRFVAETRRTGRLFFDSCPFRSLPVSAIRAATTPPPGTIWVGSSSKRSPKNPVSRGRRSRSFQRTLRAGIVLARRPAT